MSSQLDRWTGEFGREYTDRNVVDWRSRVEGFRQMIPDDVLSVLEVGCNMGHNLKAIGATFAEADIVGIEPSSYARAYAPHEMFPVYVGSVYDLTQFSNDFDLVFTSGVLIHVPPERLDEALAQVHLAARRYILAIEYDSEHGEDEAIDYRGHTDMLWKRNYGAHYTRLFPDLQLVDVGVAPAGFEEATFWLLKK